MEIPANIKEDRRSWKRFDLLMKANYFLPKNTWYKECAIIDISRQGACIKTPAETDIRAGSSISLELFTKEIQSVNIKGIIKWIKESENGLIIGIKFNSALDNKIYKNL
jgi:hypothetical protein